MRIQCALLAILRTGFELQIHNVPFFWPFNIFDLAQVKTKDRIRNFYDHSFCSCKHLVNTIDSTHKNIHASRCLGVLIYISLSLRCHTMSYDLIRFSPTSSLCQLLNP